MNNPTRLASLPFSRLTLAFAATTLSLLSGGSALVADSPPPASEAPYLLDLAAQKPDAVASKAAKALAEPIATIVDKPRPSPTGNAHDYVSYARYYWPDPSKPDGLPFLRHDGHHNETQVHLGDEPRLNQMSGNLQALALGWAVLHREDCARRAGDWLRAWFVAPATRMNPNLEFSQIRLGHDNNHGSNSGVLDGRTFADVADALRLLHGSPAMTEEDAASVRAWFSDYLHWLLTGENAVKEYHAPNNHGSWYLVQTIAVARYCGQDDVARRLCEEDKARIASQIKPDGSQPAELARADGLGYSIFNLQAQFQVVRLAAGLGVDLWHYRAADGVSLRTGLNYLQPFNTAPEKWPGNELKKVKAGFLDSLLAQAAQFDHSPK